MKILIITLSLLLISCKEKNVEVDCDERFAEIFKEAFESEDIDKLMNLYYLEGVDEITAKSLERALKYNFGTPIEKVDISSLPPGYITEYEHSGNKYKINLEPIKELTVYFQSNPENKDGITSESMSVPIGKKSDRCYVATAAKVSN